MYHPTSFPGQQPDEHVVVVLHRHWFVFVRHLAQVLLMATLPLAILAVVITMTEFQLDAGTLSYALLVMGGGLYGLFLLMLLYGYWLDYALDVFIVSDKRVVDIEQAGLFNRTVSEQRLFRVQDVTYEVKGMLRTFLKFGDVHIQTAGEKVRFVFEDVPHPDRVTELILREADKLQVEGRVDPTDPDTILKSTKPVAHHQHPPNPKA